MSRAKDKGGKMKKTLVTQSAKLRISMIIALAALMSMLSLNSQAAVFQYSGAMTATTGVFETFIPAPLPLIDGFIEFDDAAIAAGFAGAGDILGMEINLGPFCVATDLAGCAPGVVAMPITGINFSAVTFAGGLATGGSMLVTGVLTTPIQLTLPIIFSLDVGVWFADGGPFGTLAGTGSLVSPIPVPAAAWLFGSALLGLVALTRRRA